MQANALCSSSLLIRDKKILQLDIHNDSTKIVQYMTTIIEDTKHVSSIIAISPKSAWLLHNSPKAPHTHGCVRYSSTLAIFAVRVVAELAILRRLA